MKTLLIIMAIALIEAVAVVAYIDFSINRMAQQGVTNPLPADVVVRTGQQELERIQGTVNYQDIQKDLNNGSLVKVN